MPGTQGSHGKLLVFLKLAKEQPDLLTLKSNHLLSLTDSRLVLKLKHFAKLTGFSKWSKFSSATRFTSLSTWKKLGEGWHLVRLGSQQSLLLNHALARIQPSKWTKPCLMGLKTPWQVPSLKKPLFSEKIQKLFHLPSSGNLNSYNECWRKRRERREGMRFYRTETRNHRPCSHFPCAPESLLGKVVEDKAEKTWGGEIPAAFSTSLKEAIIVYLWWRLENFLSREWMRIKDSRSVWPKPEVLRTWSRLVAIWMETKVIDTWQSLVTNWMVKEEGGRRWSWLRLRCLPSFSEARKSDKITEIYC